MSAIRWQSRYCFEDVLGESESLQHVLALAKRSAETGYPTLVVGETGTGKELVAHAIHQAGPSSQGPFVALNCGMLSGEIATSELCGSEPGAFTGAERTTHLGLLDAAHHGTLFLDELQDMPSKPQSVLLRFLETGDFVRVGGNRPVHASVRLIAALNVDVREAEQRGLVRPDLLYRLNYITLEIPPLRERPQDIRPIAAKCLREDLHFLGHVDEGFWRALETCPYPWPGNAREIRNVLLKAILVSSGGRLTADDLPRSLWASCDRVNGASNGITSRRRSRDQKVAEDGRAIDAVLRACDNNVSEAARRLGLNRSTIYRRLGRVGRA